LYNGLLFRGAGQDRGGARCHQQRHEAGRDCAQKDGKVLRHLHNALEKVGATELKKIYEKKSGGEGLFYKKSFISQTVLVTLL
jgi:hypothetical protein